jgi:hypothetical protein
MMNLKFYFLLSKLAVMKTTKSLILLVMFAVILVSCQKQILQKQQSSSSIDNLSKQKSDTVMHKNGYMVRFIGADFDSWIFDSCRNEKVTITGTLNFSYRWTSFKANGNAGTIYTDDGHFKGKGVGVVTGTVYQAEGHGITVVSELKEGGIFIKDIRMSLQSATGSITTMLHWKFITEAGGKILLSSIRDDYESCR